MSTQPEVLLTTLCSGASSISPGGYQLGGITGEGGGNIPSVPVLDCQRRDQHQMSTFGRCRQISLAHDRITMMKMVIKAIIASLGQEGLASLRELVFPTVSPSVPLWIRKWESRTADQAIGIESKRSIPVVIMTD